MTTKIQPRTISHTLLVSNGSPLPPLLGSIFDWLHCYIASFLFASPLWMHALSPSFLLLMVSGYVIYSFTVSTALPCNLFPSFLLLSSSITHSPKVLSNFVVLFSLLIINPAVSIESSIVQAKRFWVPIRCQSIMLIFHIFLNFNWPHFQWQNAGLTYVYGYSFLAPGARELFWKALNSYLCLGFYYYCI